MIAAKATFVINSGLKFLSIADLPDEMIRVKIFDIAGEKVLDREIRPTGGEWEWNLTNDSGEKVASGIYIYLLQNKDLTKRGELAIIYR
ncbi:hypothetical protein KJ693_05785 [bacterium]|nr:hypothetical protein [bacterium]MBU1614809.1 hypothetical protein [bacterium]